MADLDKDVVKLAIREVMDELTVTYAVGAGAFLDRVMNSLVDMADAMDEFYTRNLAKDRPESALLFLDLRIRGARNAQEILSRKIDQLQAMQVDIKTGREIAVNRRATARKRATKKKK